MYSLRVENLYKLFFILETLQISYTFKGKTLLQDQRNSVRDVSLPPVLQIPNQCFRDQYN